MKAVIEATLKRQSYFDSAILKPEELCAISKNKIFYSTHITNFVKFK